MRRRVSNESSCLNNKHRQLRAVCKTLADKTDRTPEEDDMLEMMTADGSRVGKENLAAVLKWMNDRK